MRPGLSPLLRLEQSMYGSPRTDGPEDLSTYCIAMAITMTCFCDDMACSPFWRYQLLRMLWQRSTMCFLYKLANFGNCHYSCWSMQIVNHAAASNADTCAWQQNACNMTQTAHKAVRMSCWLKCIAVKGHKLMKTEERQITLPSILHSAHVV